MSLSIAMPLPKPSPLNSWSIFLIFFKLGLTSFGGPIAHLGYFHHEFVQQRKWLNEKSYADLVALCQFLPGPASSQVGIALGFYKGSYIGALSAWAGFTLPSALALIFLALGLTHYDHVVPAGLLHGLEIVAVAVVAQALWGMARNLCPDAIRISIMAAAACCAVLIPSFTGQLISILGAALVGVMLFRPQVPTEHSALAMPIKPLTGVLWLILFVVLLVGLPVLNTLFPNQTLALIDVFYRAGSLVFGGGHVVLPLLQSEVVTTGWVNHDTFVAGYGATQAVPGPLFTFAAFLGATMSPSPTGWTGAWIALGAIFLPSFLLVLGTLPFWEQLRHQTRIQAAYLGINAAVVGLLLAAFYQPVWTSAIQAPIDFALAVIALVALMTWKLPPWLVVIGGGFMATLVVLFTSY